MRYWFTADTHFSHDHLIENTRPEFSSVMEHDRVLMENINKCGGTHDDVLVIVGDFAWNKPGRYRQQIRSFKHIFFVLGNHDNEHKIRNVFGGTVWTRKMVQTSQGHVVCDHHPSCYWDLSHRGIYHAYGHLHYSLEREAVMDKAFPERRSMDVGVDAAYAILGEYRPFSEDEFFAHLDNREGHDKV